MVSIVNGDLSIEKAEIDKRDNTAISVNVKAGKNEVDVKISGKAAILFGIVAVLPATLCIIGTVSGICSLRKGIVKKNNN